MKRPLGLEINVKKLAVVLRVLDRLFKNASKALIFKFIQLAKPINNLQACVRRAERY